MEFIYKDLGNRTKGEIVRFVLKGNAANVRIMTSSNFSNYKNGRRHQFYGGHATKSPVDIIIPSSGHWYATVDLGGYKGKVNASISVLPGALPSIINKPLSSVPSLLNLPNPSDPTDTREFDVFISHASEDKDAVVRPLAFALKEGGLNVWYDEFELRMGDSLRRKIDHGLSKSKVGIVVLSNSFIKKGWTNYELDGIITKTVTGEQKVLPIWHNITKKEVIEFSPSLADKLARNTAINTVEEIASEIIELVKG
jgi:hypothetical protein